MDLKILYYVIRVNDDWDVWPLTQQGMLDRRAKDPTLTTKRMDQKPFDTHEEAARRVEELRRKKL